MSYKCVNPNCGQNNVEIFVARVTTKIVKGKLVREGDKCPECGTAMENVNARKEGDPLPTIYSSVISNMSPDQKAQYLDKRATAHYNRHVKEYADHQMETAKSQMSEIRKMKK